MQKHEYALLGGVNRANVGRLISILAAFMSATLVFIVLSLVDIAKSLAIPINLPPTVLSLIGAGTVFGVLYMLFDKFIWKWGRISSLIRVPDLSGQWACSGQTLDNDGKPTHEWAGEVTIIQTWDKIRIRLRTIKSGSNSIAAALMYDEVDGYRLLYNYVNDPEVGRSELRGHAGCANLVFSKDLNSATGDYFNGYGRSTFGTMKLVRK